MLALLLLALPGALAARHLLDCPRAVVDREVLDVVGAVDRDMLRVLARDSVPAGCSVAVADADAVLEADRARLRERAAAAATASFHEAYHPLEDLVEFLRERCAHHRALCEWTASIGESVEGRALPAMQLRGRANNGSRVIMFSAHAHGRELISSAVVAWLVDRLLDGYGRPGDAATTLLDRFTFEIVPVVNPDGFVYTWEQDRAWRKSRSFNAGSPCRGTDLNRQMGSTWGGVGASTDPCSDSYRGDAGPAGEPEALALARFYEAIDGDVVAALDWHNSGQLFNYPWGFTLEEHPRAAEHAALGEAMAAAALEVHGTEFVTQPSYKLYMTSGTLKDYYAEVDLGRTLAFTVELRDKGEFGFLLPDDQIVPSGEEMWAAMQAAGDILN